ncbi:IclR family transcriptional regulator [Mycobacterium deserti]|uniref:Helix-turn-helix domain-containing protein n=1 Tax=Mycobacterium deserti TaxID=2978347 RepID=A0ABT2MBE8_9MYCO|nr:helix-turn-helix domain-containing protein [Mycobacterium deserti]MCT7659593.1 helix-turn-helix domain-containing protein [Mycobacterium deserti]
MADDHTVLGRAVAILDCVVEANGPLPLAVLTRRTGMPKPTVRRIANALAERGMLEQTPDGYMPGQRLIDHGVRSAHRQGFAVTVQPYLQDLHSRTRGQTAWVATMNQGQLTMTGAAFARPHLEGMRKPWLTYSAIGPGMVLLASGRMQAAHDAELAEQVLASQFPPMTRYSVIDKSRLRALIEAARDSGYAQETEQAVLGNSCIAAAMRNSAGDLAGIIGVAGQCSAIEARGVGAALMRSALLLQHEIRSLSCEENLDMWNAPIFNQRTGIGYTWPTADNGDPR